MDRVLAQVARLTRSIRLRPSNETEIPAVQFLQAEENHFPSRVELGLLGGIALTHSMPLRL